VFFFFKEQKNRFFNKKQKNGLTKEKTQKGCVFKKNGFFSTLVIFQSFL